MKRQGTNANDHKKVNVCNKYMEEFCDINKVSWLRNLANDEPALKALV